MQPITACKALQLLYDVFLDLWVMFLLSPSKLKMQMSDCSFLFKCTNTDIYKGFK